MAGAFRNFRRAAACAASYVALCQRVRKRWREHTHCSVSVEGREGWGAFSQKFVRCPIDILWVVTTLV